MTCDVNDSFRLWNAVSPSADEIAAAFAAFEGLRVVYILPRLVMVRRAVAADFYTDDLRSQPGSPRASVAAGNAPTGTPPRG